MVSFVSLLLCIRNFHFAKCYLDRNVSNKLEYFVGPRNFSRYLYIKLVNFVRSIFRYVDLHRFAKRTRSTVPGNRSFTTSSDNLICIILGSYLLIATNFFKSLLESRIKISHRRISSSNNESNEHVVRSRGMQRS